MPDLVTTDTLKAARNAVRTASLPISPVHVAKHIDGNQYQIPAHIDLVNRAIVRKYLSPRKEFLIIELPVRHGKSELCSMWTPLWSAGLNPDRGVLVTSHDGIHATKFTGRAKTHMQNYGQDLFGLTVSAETSAKSNWALEGHDKGGVRALSIRQSPIGSGFKLIVIDDPLKDAESADSLIDRNFIWERWSGMLRSRLDPDGLVILVMSRWHQDDIAGRAQKRTLEQPDGDQWETIHIPAIAEADDLLGRKIGEHLWDREPLKALMATKATVSPATWNSQYQQTPSAQTGGMFSPADWQDTTVIPDNPILVRGWDTASTKGGGDWTVGALIALDPVESQLVTDPDTGEVISAGYRIVIIDVVREQVNAAEQERLIKDTAHSDRNIYGHGVWNFFEQEPGSMSDTWKLNTETRLLAGFPVQIERVTGSKAVRVKPFSVQHQAERVSILNVVDSDDGVTRRPHWARDYIEEFRVFPKASHDDQVDATSAAFNWAIRIHQTESSLYGFSYG